MTLSYASLMIAVISNGNLNDSLRFISCEEIPRKSYRADRHLAAIPDRKCPASRTSANQMDGSSTGINVPKWKCCNSPPKKMASEKITTVGIDSAKNVI